MGKKYTIENKKMDTILCHYKTSRYKKYRRHKTFPGEGMRPCVYGIRYATKWVNYLNTECEGGWELCEVIK